MQSGAMPPDQGQQGQVPSTNVEYGPQNPLHGDQEQLERMCGLTREEGQRIVAEIVQPFRTQWATDRIMKMPNWLKNTEYDKGKQILGWDPISLGIARTTKSLITAILRSTSTTSPRLADATSPRP
jgi:hypothetical protein